MEFVKNFTPSDFQEKILHRQFHLILTVLVRKNTKNEWKWRNLHRWQKFNTAAGTDGTDKFHLWGSSWNHGGENAKHLTESCWIVVSNHPEIGGDWVAQCCCRVWGSIAIVAKLENDRSLNGTGTRYPLQPLIYILYFCRKWRLCLVTISQSG